MHSQFHRLTTAFAKFKADKIAGPLPVNRARQGLGFDDRTDPAVKAHKAIYVRTKSSLMGRIQVARVKSIAERIITYYNSAPKIGLYRERYSEEFLTGKPRILTKD